MKNAGKISNAVNYWNRFFVCSTRTKLCRVCGAMYGKTNGISLYKIRAEKSDKGIHVKKLPPTEDSLHQHLLRVMYQLYIWITANYVAWHKLPRAQDFWYKMVEDKC